MALRSDEIEGSLNAAFATNTLGRICRALDGAVVQSGGPTEIARAAEVDRVTLYRAFRLEGWPALDIMTKVLRELGFQLTVELSDEKAIGHSHGKAAATARRFAAAFKTGKTETLLQVFADTVRAQKKRCGLRASNDNEPRKPLSRFLSQP